MDAEAKAITLMHMNNQDTPPNTHTIQLGFGIIKCGDTWVTSRLYATLYTNIIQNELVI